MDALSPVIRFYHESVEETKEDNFGPSMVEECYNPSIHDLFTNPSLALRHQRHGSYDSDKNEEVSETDTSWDSDIQELPTRFGMPSSKSTRKRVEEPKADDESRSSEANDAERSEAKQNESDKESDEANPSRDVRDPKNPS